MSRHLITKPGALQAPQLDYILFDGSYSMQDKWWDCIAALDGFMDVLKAQNVHSHGIVSVFNSACLSDIQRDGLLSDWPSFASAPVVSEWGTTPLYDAINHMGRTLKDLDPPSCSIVIVTDGHEQGSRHTDATQARAILDWCRAKGWQVTFLGADFNNAKQAELLGADPTNMIGVQKKLLGAAGKRLGEKRAHHARSGDDINFTKDEQESFGGYLTQQKDQ